jgi:hypothetical protein
MKVTLSSVINRHLKFQWIAVLLSCALVVGCATEKKPAQGNGTSATIQVPVDLVSILAKFAELDESSPVEKFERYFRTKVEKYPHPELAEVWKLKGAGYASTVLVSLVGHIYNVSNNTKIDQSATIQLPFTSACISPKEMQKKLPQLIRSNHYGAAHPRHDDPSKNVSYMGHSISSEYGYVIYRFMDDECLREIGISQKTP